MSTDAVPYPSSSRGLAAVERAPAVVAAGNPEVLRPAVRPVVGVLSHVKGGVRLAAAHSVTAAKVPHRGRFARWARRHVGGGSVGSFFPGSSAVHQSRERS